MTAAIALPSGVDLPPAARLLRAAQAVQQARAGNATLKLHWSLYSGDLWSGGLGWSGPRPDPLNDRTPGNAARVVLEIERTFVSRNLAKDVVDRHQAGVAGREPLTTIAPRRIIKKGEKPTTQEQVRIDQYTAALTDWWDEAGAWPAVQEALRVALTTGRGSVRVYIHDSNLDDLVVDGKPARGVRSGLTLSEAARRISVHAPKWDQAGVTRDRDGHVTGAYHRWEDGQGRDRWEIHERVNGKSVIHPELLSGGTDAEGRPAITYPVPDLLIYELRLDPLLTDSVRRLVMAANKTLTMGSRNIDLGGFVERTILNAQMPGEMKTLADGTKKFVPDPYNVGAGATNFLSGLAVHQRDEKGKMVPTGQFATPSVVYKDPAAFDVFKLSFEQLREAILDEANQLHVLIAGDASASGVSRQQAVNDFLSSLEPTRIALEQLLRWLLDAVLRLALYFTGRTGEADDMRVRAQARISAVQKTPAEIQAAIALHQAGIGTEETALLAAGEEDVDATRAARLAEGITPALALVLLDKAPTWIGVRALQLAYPVLNITDQHVQAHFEADTAGGAEPTQPADLTGGGEDVTGNAEP